MSAGADRLRFESDDQIRLIFAGAIVASWFGYLQTQTQIVSLVGETAYRYAFLTISASAALSFLFLLAFAAKVKYIRKGKLDEIQITAVDRIAFYDLSVDVFELIPWFVLYGTLHKAFSSGYSDGIAWVLATLVAFAIWTGFLLLVGLFTRNWVRFQRLRKSKAVSKFANGRRMEGVLFFILGVLAGLLIRS